jgi:hypothetical protein
VLTGKIEGEDLLASRDLWEAVMRKLEGLKVSSVSNLVEAMLDVSRVRMLQAEKDLQAREAALLGEIEQLKQQISFLQADSNRKDGVVWAYMAEAKTSMQLPK